jgi:hypothetical protein
VLFIQGGGLNVSAGQVGAVVGNALIESLVEPGVVVNNKRSGGPGCRESTSMQMQTALAWLAPVGRRTYAAAVSSWFCAMLAIV